MKILKREFILENCGDCGDYSLNSIVVFMFGNYGFKGIYCKNCLQEKIRKLVWQGYKNNDNS